MNIPKQASILHMPITKNIPLDVKNAGSWWKKFKLWKWGISDELLVEDFYQELPKTCNKILGFSIEEKVCVFIPKTFIFNGASIPRALSPLYLPNGILYIGAFLHDFCYGFEGLIIYTEEMKELKFTKVNQFQADNIFYEINMEANNFKTACKPAYIALRGFGWLVWNKCRKNENVFIKKFPEYKHLIK